VIAVCHVTVLQTAVNLNEEFTIEMGGTLSDVSLAPEKSGELSIMEEVRFLSLFLLSAYIFSQFISSLSLFLLSVYFFSQSISSLGPYFLSVYFLSQPISCLSLLLEWFFMCTGVRVRTSTLTISVRNST